MSPYSQRGSAAVIVIIVLGIGALVGWSKPWKFFEKQPPLKQLAAAQQKLDAANARAADAEKKLADAQKADTDAKLAQVQYSQQMVHGATTALSRAPASPEVQVAISLNTRADAALSAAIGQLPPALAAEIDAAVTQALAAKDNEIATLNTAIAARDAALKAASTERDALKVQIPVLTANVATAETKAAAAQAVVTAKQDQVNTYAAKAAAADQATFGLQGLYSGLRRTLVIVAIGIVLFLVGYIGVHFILPSLAQEYPAAATLQSIYRTITSLVSAHQVTTATAVNPPK